MNTSEAVASYLILCQFRRLARPTMASYRWGLGRLERSYPDLPTNSNQLLPIVGDKSLGLESARHLLRVLKAFFHWAAVEYGVPNPTLELARLPRRRRLPEVLEADQVRRLMGAARSERDQALTVLVMDTGIRLGELAGLRVGDLGRSLRVSGKSGTRLVPVTPAVAALVLGQATDRHGDGLWMGRRGALGVDGVRQVFERLFSRAGVTGPKRSGPHILRHTFGTFYCRAGGNVRILQEIMGHTELRTTMVYVHLAGQDVAADHAEYSPVRTLELV